MPTESAPKNNTSPITRDYFNLHLPEEMTGSQCNPQDTTCDTDDDPQDNLIFFRSLPLRACTCNVGNPKPFNSWKTWYEPVSAM